MDYSLKGILVMLQDLQRIHFGKMTMYVEVIMSDDNEPILSCCVFDKDDNPHVNSFHTFESEDEHKREYMNVLELIKDTIDGQGC